MKLQWERHAVYAFRAKSETGEDWIIADLGGGRWACGRRTGEPTWLATDFADAFTADKFCQAIEDSAFGRVSVSEIREAVTNGVYSPFEWAERAIDRVRDLLAKKGLLR